MKRAASGRERLLFVSKQPGFPLEDPSTAGARVELLSPSGYASFDVPAGLGNPGWYRDGMKQLYKFRNGSAPDGLSAIRLLVLQNGKQIKISARSTGLMLGGLQSVGVRITTGSVRNCVLFNDSRSTIVKDVATEFAARDAVDTPALADCSTETLGGGACGNGVIEADETCDGAADAACSGQCQADCTCPPPTCGDQDVNQPSEECDGSDDAACPGNCQPSCVCLGVCGDGIVNQPSESCDGSADGCIEPAFFGCQPPGSHNECSCCSLGGFSCDMLGCCDPERTCIPGPQFSGTCCFGSPGHACQGDGDCCYGMVCGGSGCCGPAAFPCASGAACCSGSCTGNVCDP